MAAGPAMTETQVTQAMEVGIELVMAEMAKGLDIVGTGDMGIGNTTVSSAIYAVMMGKPVAEVTGRGTGLDDEQLTHKIAVINRALAVNKPDPTRPLDVLAKVGGFEIGLLAGVILGTAANRRAVVLDGFIAGAAALIAHGLSRQVSSYCLASHLSTETGHKKALTFLGLRPMFNLDLRLGEGSGAALGMLVIEAASRCLTEMATFTDAGVSEKKPEDA